MVQRKAVREENSGRVIYTVGHSTLTIEEIVALLRAFAVRQVVDIRTIPRSRHNPQFNRETLSLALRNRRINYRHMKELGGLRHARADSPNQGWRNASFRGFADYMQTPEFAAGLEKLIALARRRLTCIVCAEAVPWRCHRSLIGDALVARGIHVEDLFGNGRAKPHRLSPMAVLRGTRILYPENTVSRSTKY